MNCSKALKIKRFKIRATWALAATLMVLGMLVVYGALFYLLVVPGVSLTLSMTSIDPRSSVEISLEIAFLTTFVYVLARRMRSVGKIQNCKHA